ncbi:hypothetical protein BH09PSE2_BH09PSE2_08080 [soil metagenome]
MRSYSFPALILGLAAVAGTAACNPKPLAQANYVGGGGGGVHVATSEAMPGAVTVSDKLDCPTEVGSLTRTSAAADGGACDYKSDKGVVHLALTDNAGDAKAALAPLRSELDGELPGVAQKATIQVVTDRDATGHKSTKVDMPFIHVDESGGRSHVRLLGINIDADKDKKDKADDQDDDDKAAAASSTPAEQRGVELVYVLVGGRPSALGFHVVGYVAKGPPTGKLVVATFRYAKGDHFNKGDRHDDEVDQLMKLNVKPG